MEKKTGKELVSCIGENCYSSAKSANNSVQNLDRSMFNITNADFNMEQNKSSKKDEEDEKLKAE